MIKNLFAGVVAFTAMTSCVGDGSGYAGIPYVHTSSVAYANTPYGWVAFASYGNWTMVQNSGNDWCKFDIMKGYGNSAYVIPAKLGSNRTGKYRTADFRIQDVDEKDAYGTFFMSQYGTRGDGSYGSAPLVSAIKGDDGSEVTIVYDTELCRPQTIRMSKNGSVLANLAFEFSSSDTALVVRSGSSSLEGAYDNGFQTTELLSSTDTVWYNTNGGVLGNTLAFNFEHRKKDGDISAQALLLPHRIPNPDSDVKFDSLSYIHKYADGRPQYLEKLKPSYSDKSNRTQSVDVNQLLLGIEECSPYALLALFRTVRSSHIISEAVGVDGKYAVTTTHNPDNSVATMTVTDKAGDKVTYTFEYSNVQ